MLRFTIAGSTAPVLLSAEEIVALRPATFNPGTLLWLRGNGDPFHVNESFDFVTKQLGYPQEKTTRGT